MNISIYEYCATQKAEKQQRQKQQQRAKAIATAKATAGLPPLAKDDN
jgi:hypothetical protein